MVKTDKCIVCGARVTWERPNTNTCSPTCTRARDKGISRADQEAWENDHWYSKRSLRDAMSGLDLPITYPDTPAILDPDKIKNQRDDERENL